ncbi:unnamed protein product [Nezara viridula]|uniref:Uncharacterized protein n=1 Tax=Nezara viridula TaxID=85310 RepID=A0A9P0EFW0_NEZVI|nr:unnamed protein product [Nezara viridula]
MDAQESRESMRSEAITTSWLKEEEMAQHFQEEINKMARESNNPWDSDDVEQSWLSFKKIILDAARLVCGEKRAGSRFKRSPIMSRRRSRKRRKHGGTSLAREHLQPMKSTRKEGTRPR